MMVCPNGQMRIEDGALECFFCCHSIKSRRRRQFLGIFGGERSPQPKSLAVITPGGTQPKTHVDRFSQDMRAKVLLQMNHMP